MTAPIPLIASSDIATRLQAIGKQIDADYAGRALDIVCLINGASVFCADLVRHITVPAKIHPLSFSSYHSPNPSGEVRVTLDVAEPLRERHVLIVEGIIVSGRTPNYIVEMLRLRQPASLAICALGVKRKALIVDLPIAYAAFDFGSEIVVGYGIGDGPEKMLPYLTTRSAPPERTSG